jgi:restriction endonuclease S subunit
MKLKHITDIRTGLSLVRKRGEIYDDYYKKYRVLTLKSFTDSNYPSLDYLDEFIATEELEPQYLTQHGDIIVRLRAPNKAVYIGEEKYLGLVVPAFMSIIRIIDIAKVDVEFLTFYINSNLVQSKLSKEANDTAIPMVKNMDITELEIQLPPVELQKKTVEYMKLANKEINILNQLIAVKNKLKNEIFETNITKTKEFNQ